MVCVRRTHGYVIIHLVRVAVEWLVVSLSSIRHYICKYNTVKFYTHLLVCIITWKSRCFNFYVFINSYVLLLAGFTTWCTKLVYGLQRRRSFLTFEQIRTLTCLDTDCLKKTLLRPIHAPSSCLLSDPAPRVFAKLAYSRCEQQVHAFCWERQLDGFQYLRQDVRLEFPE